MATILLLLLLLTAGWALRTHEQLRNLRTAVECCHALLDDFTPPHGGLLPRLRDALDRFIPDTLTGGQYCIDSRDAEGVLRSRLRVTSLSDAHRTAQWLTDRWGVGTTSVIRRDTYGGSGGTTFGQYTFDLDGITWHSLPTSAGPGSAPASSPSSDRTTSVAATAQRALARLDDSFVPVRPLPAPTTSLR